MFDYPTHMRIASTRFLALTLFGAFVLASTGCGPKYPKCKKDSHCEEKGEVCVEGLCQQCRDEEQCAEGEECKGGRCEVKPECVRDKDCTGNKVCRSGKCKIECQSDKDCGSGLKCSSNRCVDELACNNNGDCSGGMTCISGRCTSSNVQASRSMPCSYPTVRFPFNQATLNREVKEGLEEVVACVKSKGGTIRIEGHCDERGTEEYNLALGDRRARAVRKYLNRMGVPNTKLEIISKGELEPIDSGSNESAWAANRRAEFIEN